MYVYTYIVINILGRVVLAVLLNRIASIIGFLKNEYNVNIT